jgi:hypothetical protein
MMSMSIGNGFILKIPWYSAYERHALFPSSSLGGCRGANKTTIYNAEKAKKKEEEKRIRGK